MGWSDELFIMTSWNGNIVRVTDLLGGEFSDHNDSPDSVVHGANMGPTWDRQDPGGPILAPWILLSELCLIRPVYFLLMTLQSI